MRPRSPRHCAPMPGARTCASARSRPASRMSSSTSCARRTAPRPNRHGRQSEYVRAAPLSRHPRQGIRPGAARPAHVRDDDRRAGDAAGALRLRDQPGPEGAAGGGGGGRRYNPEGVTQYNIVPGLMGVVLTMTMVMMTSLAMTRERERGTMESLLATPVLPLEVMLGKIAPYILIGYVQVVVILIAAAYLFRVPIVGSLALLSLVLVLFMATNLAIGFTFSTFAKSQMQAMQMTFFFFLPSMLLSGFMFPFRGMPDWAQALVLAVVSAAALLRYRRTLD